MQDKLELRSFLILLLVVSLGFLWLLKPFFAPIFWACAIAVIFSPLQQRLIRAMPKSPNSATLLTLLTCVLIVVLPVVFIVSSVVSEGLQLYHRLQSGEINPAAYIEQVRAAFPAIEQALERFDIRMDKLKEQAVDAAMTSGKFLAQNAFSIGQNAFGWVLSLCLMLYLAFFVLRDGDKLVELLIRALPLGDARERLLLAKFAEVTRATVKGNLVVAMVQGALGGVIFWFLDIQGALLWGVMMAVASLIPAIGAAIIWLPAAIYLLATGEYVEGIILIAFGAGVIGLVDNILRPILVGRDTKLPDYLVLLSTLGGIVLFGISGFVVGPLLAALFIAFWEIFMREIHVIEEQTAIEEQAEKTDSAPQV